MMAKIEKTNLPDIVVKEIQNKIMSGEWQSGFKLPSESSLGEMFGVNRLTVRLAINKLATLGVLETVNGLGTFVKDFDLDSYFRQAGVFFLTDENIDDFREFRNLIELYCASKFIENYSQKNVDNLKEILHRYADFCKEADEDELDEFVRRTKEFEWEFHSTIVNCGNNSVISGVYAMTKYYFEGFLDSIVRRRISKRGFESFIEKSLARHSRLLKMLEDKDSDEFNITFIAMTNYWED